MTTAHRLAVAVTAGLVVALLAACASSGQVARGAGVTANGERGWHGTTVADGYPLPTVPFTDTAGASTTLADEARTPVTLVFFGYTHCPDICNVVLANVASALRGTTPAVRKDVRLLFVSTDPQRDTTKVVRDYLDRFDPRFEGLVAPVDDVAKAARALYISYEKPDGSTGGSYQVDHGTYTTAFVRGKARLVWSDTTTVADLRADLVRLRRASVRSS
jgi:protein SCO1/2